MSRRHGRLAILVWTLLSPLLMCAPAWSAGPEMEDGSLAASRWTPQAPLAVPAVPAGLPAAAAGCLVIGHWVMPDGSTAAARVLRGAFTGHVPKPTQHAFEAAALASVPQWRFAARDDAAVREARRIRGVDEESLAAGQQYNVEVLGFAPEATAVVFSLSAQDARVRPACDIKSVSAWGEASAMPVAQARARGGERMLTTGLQDTTLFWVSTAPMRAPAFPREAVLSSSSACVVAGYVIGVDGVPTGLRVMTSSFTETADRNVRQAFENAALYAASVQRFSPGPDNLARLPEFRQLQGGISAVVGKMRRGGSDRDALTDEVVVGASESAGHRSPADPQAGFCGTTGLGQI